MARISARHLRVQPRGWVFEKSLAANAWTSPKRELETLSWLAAEKGLDQHATVLVFFL